MSDNILSAVLTFSLLAGGTAAIGTEMFNTRRAPEPAKVVMLPMVTVTGHRASASAEATLPMVTVIGRRATATALAEAAEGRAVRVE